MEKLLKDLINETKKLVKETKELRKEQEKSKKEIVNYLAFQSQVQKQILTNIIKLNKPKEEDNGNN